MGLCLSLCASELYTERVEWMDGLRSLRLLQLPEDRVPLCQKEFPIMLGLMEALDLIDILRKKVRKV